MKPLGSRSPGFRYQVFYTLTKLCSNTGPISHTIEINPEPLFLPAGDRIEKSNSLNPSSIPFITAIGYHDVVERPFLGSASCQSNFYHSIKPFNLVVLPAKQ